MELSQCIIISENGVNHLFEDIEIALFNMINYSDIDKIQYVNDITNLLFLTIDEFNKQIAAPFIFEQIFRTSQLPSLYTMTKMDDLKFSMYKKYNSPIIIPKITYYDENIHNLIISDLYEHVNEAIKDTQGSLTNCTGNIDIIYDCDNSELIFDFTKFIMQNKSRIQINELMKRRAEIDKKIIDVQSENL